MQRAAAVRAKGWQDTHPAAGQSRVVKVTARSAAGSVVRGVKKARKAHKRVTRHRVKPFRFHV
jgi:hypothetical protein